MLKRSDGSEFATGRSKYDDHNPGDPQATAKIHIKINPGSLGVMLAEVDTGGAYSILDSDVAEALGLLDGDGPEQELKSSTGNALVKGRLERIPLVVLADHGQGQSLEISDALFLVPRDWRRKTILGYTALLQVFRFAVDPHSNWFYFGP